MTCAENVNNNVQEQNITYVYLLCITIYVLTIRCTIKAEINVVNIKIKFKNNFTYEKNVKNFILSK